MMPISPPTDNLYKFCAITGVIIVLTSLYIPLTLSHDLRRQVAAVKLDLSKAEIESKYVTEEAARYRKIVENYNNGLTEDKSRARGKMPVIISEQEFKEGLAALLKAAKDVELKTAEIRSGSEQSEDLLSELRFVRNTAYGSSFFGLVLALFGFRRWYEKIQIYQDKLLQRQAKQGSV